MDTTILVNKLESVASLSRAERDLLVNMPGKVIELQAQEDFVREGDRPSRTCIVLDGLACSYTVLAAGRRQITAFHIPGDIPDLHSLFVTTMDHSLCSLTPSRILAVSHRTILDIIDRHPVISRLLWRDTMVDAAIFREWMVGIGRRPAYGRIAHLFCEMLLRMQAVGLSSGHTCEFHATQLEIGDALGLSTVHVNRSLQELRRAGLLNFENGLLTVLDWDGLREAADFDPVYLHYRADRLAS